MLNHSKLNIYEIGARRLGVKRGSILRKAEPVGHV